MQARIYVLDVPLPPFIKRCTYEQKMQQKIYKISFMYAHARRARLAFHISMSSA